MTTTRARRVRALAVFAAAAVCAAGLAATQASATPIPGTFAALEFDGVNDYVTFGNPASLRLSTFTVETWFKREGAGVATTTTGAKDGVNGFSNATTDGVIPLVAKGRGDGDKTTKDLNYVLGIHTSGVLAGDVEEGAAAAKPGRNHKILGVTAVTSGVWHHAALTYDGTTLALYLDGALERAITVGQPPRSDSIEPASLGTALNSTGAARGFFAGVIDEARIWNRALTPSEIAAGMGGELTSGPGLVARWGMNEGAGTTVTDSVGAANGTATKGPLWVDGRQFGAVNQAPDAPTSETPADGATGVSASPHLAVQVSDPDGDPVDVTFYGRRAPTAQAADDFAVAVFPDTQFYSQSYPDTYLAQARWVVQHKDDLNIAYVAHVGDMVQSIDGSELEWQRADAAEDVVDASGLPYGVVPGNHDEASGGVARLYDTYFAPSRFAGKPWYLGYLGDSLSGAAQGTGSDGVSDAGVDRLNKDNYEVVQAGGVRWVFIGLEWGLPGYAVSWTQRVIDAQLAVDPDTEFVLVSHAFLNSSGVRPTAAVNRSGATSAEQVWQTLVRPNCNVHLVLSGHYSGEARRTDLNACGEPVHQVMADFQSRPNGGNGWLRYLTFHPADGTIDVHTYSPTLGEFETDADSQFTLDLPMAQAAETFQVLGSDDAVPSGGTASLAWSGLDASTPYEWYAVAGDGKLLTPSARWSFTTQP